MSTGISWQVEASQPFIYKDHIDQSQPTQKRVRELTKTAPDLKAKRVRSPFNRDFMERYPEVVELHNKIKNVKCF